MPPPLAFVARDSCSGVTRVCWGNPWATSPWISPIRLSVDHGRSCRYGRGRCSIFVCRGFAVSSQRTAYPGCGEYCWVRGRDGQGRSRRKRGGHHGLVHPGYRSGKGSSRVGLYEPCNLGGCDPGGLGSLVIRGE